MSRLILCTLLMVTPMILTSYTRANSSFKVSKDEQVKVDLGKNFEKYVMQDGGKKVTVMYDFNKRLTLIKLPGPQSFCILRASTGHASRPAALQKALKSLKKNSKVKVLQTTEEKLTVGSNVTFEELSHLSKEMADLCKNLPIKWVKAGRKNDIEQVQDTGDNHALVGGAVKRISADVDKTSAPDVFSSCSFIPIAHSETKVVMVSCYGYEI
ncbi:unnamed protein product [Porites evermanni]|uniref:BRICHOS domain-containing protein n=1 Tax=Porites evermanni TaxID=104178 RepID=A0ABN8PZD9_9CNID|nr:unnamed protein product [Porites evermanni]